MQGSGPSRAGGPPKEPCKEHMQRNPGIELCQQAGRLQACRQRAQDCSQVSQRGRQAASTTGGEACSPRGRAGGLLASGALDAA